MRGSSMATPIIGTSWFLEIRRADRGGAADVSRGFWDGFRVRRGIFRGRARQGAGSATRCSIWTIFTVPNDLKANFFAPSR